ncbi:aldehyde dehydrogenase [Streptomyces sp. NPDC090080]|uniref:aldehyde dehydrogenase n=1 Tax=Streptomyces sp. NPDC090080 TaxID=3365939 RepID=UPI00380FCA7D
MPLGFSHHESLFIDGKWSSPSTDRQITVSSANTTLPIGSVPEAAKADVDRAVAAARTAFDSPQGWAQWEPTQRADALERLAGALEKRREETARLVSAQNGFPISVAEMFCGTVPAALLRYYAELARDQQGDEFRPGILPRPTVIHRSPLGVVAAITPWNYPQTLAFFKLAPALAAGCTVVLKPSPETVLDSCILAEAIEEAELPGGVINIVPSGREVSSYLVTHPDVDKVSFTGSTAAGRQIASACGELLRPVTLELGGKSAAIILDDAELGDLAESLFVASLLNNGQTCFANTRILAPTNRYEELVDLYTTLAREARVGDSLDPSTQIGPLVSSAQRDRVESYIAQGKRSAARLTTGGGRPTTGLDGWFVEPTVFADVSPSDVIAQEEIFGPVLSIISYTDVEHAVRIANDSVYGLAGSVWSSDEQRALDVAKQVRTGTVGINGYVIDVAAPFGGRRDSGLGRELGPEALTDFMNVKSIYRP